MKTLKSLIRIVLIGGSIAVLVGVCTNTRGRWILGPVFFLTVAAIAECRRSKRKTNQS